MWLVRQYLMINVAIIIPVILLGVNSADRKSPEILNRKLGNHYYAPLIDTNAKCLVKNHTINALPHQRYVQFYFGGDYPPNTKGLGNILFPFAVAHNVALNYNKTFLKIRDHTVLEWLSFDVDCKELYLDQFKPVGDLYNLEDNNELGIYRYKALSDISPTLNYKVHGYFQSYKYFDTLFGRRFMYQGLNVLPPLATAAQEFMQIFKNNISSHREIVCVHVRLGDKFNNFRDRDGKRKTSGSHWVADGPYLKVAMQWFDNKLSKNNVYLLVTDNLDVIKDWKIQQYSNQSITYTGDYFLSSDHNSSLIELEILLNHCNHHLLTSGSFGWWAGWKSKGHVLFSELQYVNDNKDMWNPAIRDDHFPPNFHLVYPCPNDIDRYCGIREPKDPSWNNWKNGL